MSKQQQPPVYPDEPKIPILPNMLTAGNLLCGFFAILTIFRGMHTPGEAFACYQQATYLIFAACAFDLLDGRVARMCKADGPFGREFDSIADVVSFGMAPSLLLVGGVLFKLPHNIGWGVAVLYMLCAALRLARFNCMAAAPKKPNQSMDFVGLPVPMAAGAVVSTFYLVSYFEEGAAIPQPMQYVMAVCMAVVSVLMMSRVIYPSFKHVNFEKKGTAMAILLAAMVVVLFILNAQVTPAVIFLCYLLYGLVVRPFLTRRVRHLIEVKDDDEQG